jgi:hypothetical protein
MTLPKVLHHRPNFCEVTVGPLTLWFSYQTIVAFMVGTGRCVVRQNEWGPTTGKHLTMIDGGEKASRVPGDQFEALWAQALQSAFTPEENLVRLKKALLS